MCPPPTGKPQQASRATRGRKVAADAKGWTFLSNHGHVLVHISQDSDARLRDIAAAVGITERAATAIINDLVEAGYITRVREGRRNRYTVHKNRRFRHPNESGQSVDELLRIFS